MQELIRNENNGKENYSHSNTALHLYVYDYSLMTNEKDFFPSLTGVRFIAASCIFLFHYIPFQNNIFLGVCNELYTGVGLFFVLSGFLIIYK
jgi:hypothetical protein